jgi:prevent-host-death family protein
MRTMSAKDAKNSFGMLLDYARAEPVKVEKHGRPVVVVISVEEFERLNQPTLKQPTRGNGKSIDRVLVGRAS